MIEIEQTQDRFDREAISRHTREAYSVEHMASNFIFAIRDAT
jgi:hypothetical protein